MHLGELGAQFHDQRIGLGDWMHRLRQSGTIRSTVRGLSSALTSGLVTDGLA
jgi:hypothetical protein